MLSQTDELVLCFTNQLQEGVNIARENFGIKLLLANFTRNDVIWLVCSYKRNWVRGKTNLTVVPF
jgi:hypothetical protein